MAEKREFGPRHALIETYREMIAKEYGRIVTREEVLREAGLDLIALHGYGHIKRPVNFSVGDPIITAEELRSLSMSDHSFNGTVYVPTERVLHVGSRSFPFGQREAQIIHPLIAHPNKLMFKDIFIQVIWNYPPEITKMGRPTFNSGMNRIRQVLRDLHSEVAIITVPGVGYKLK